MSTNPPQLPKAAQSRKYLTEKEIESLMAAAKKNRNPVRDQLLIWTSYRHGLRSIELVNLQWQSVDLELARLHIWRAKNGRVGVHPLHGREMRLLRSLYREHPGGDLLFLSERGGPLSRRAVRKIIKTLGERAGLLMPIHHHMLRHSCGYALANQGQDTRSIQDYLGHKNIHHTVIYTALSPQRFDGFWQNRTNYS